jgi:hypothetical protein
MPIPPLSRARATSPRRARSSNAAAPATAPSAWSKPTCEPRRPVVSPQTAADDFAFTHDPLSGSVTLHAGPDATRRIVEGAAAEDPAIARRLGAYRGYGEPDQVTISRNAPVSWSELEPAASPAAENAETHLVCPVRNPDAVH